MVPATTSSSPAPTTPPKVPAANKALVIMEENHTQAQANAHMPYLVRLQKAYGFTTHHTAATHPSLPNYLEIAGGSTFGVTDDDHLVRIPSKGHRCSVRRSPRERRPAPTTKR